MYHKLYLCISREKRIVILYSGPNQLTGNVHRTVHIQTYVISKHSSNNVNGMLILIMWYLIMFSKHYLYIVRGSLDVH